MPIAFFNLNSSSCRCSLVRAAAQSAGTYLRRATHGSQISHQHPERKPDYEIKLQAQHCHRWRLLRSAASGTDRYSGVGVAVASQPAAACGKPASCCVLRAHGSGCSAAVPQSPKPSSSWCTLLLPLSPPAGLSGPRLGAPLTPAEALDEDGRDLGIAAPVYSF